MKRKTIRGSGVHDAGLLASGNINLNTRPVVYNPEGGYSTVNSSSYGNEQGVETLIPLVSDEGKIMQPREAAEYWAKKGKNLGQFASPSQADAYAMWLHNQQEAQYGGWGLLPPRRGLQGGGPR